MSFFFFSFGQFLFNFYLGRVWEGISWGRTITGQASKRNKNLPFPCVAEKVLTRKQFWLGREVIGKRRGRPEVAYILPVWEYSQSHSKSLSTTTSRPLSLALPSFCALQGHVAHLLSILKTNLENNFYLVLPSSYSIVFLFILFLCHFGPILPTYLWLLSFFSLSTPSPAQPNFITQS